MTRYYLFVCLLFLALPSSAQWQPGEVYREYTWTTPEDFHEAFLRVGGKYGYAANPGKLPDHLQDNGQLIIPEVLMLTGAVRAEVTVEKVMSHEDSRNLKIAINGHAPLAIPEPASVPEPQTEYMYHTDLTIPVPLEHLRDGQPIRFALSIDSTQRWNWPQNLFYGITFRIYYEDDVQTMPEVVTTGETLGEITYLSAETQAETVSIDYIFIGESVDWSGRGITNRKHWQTLRNEPHHIIGSSIHSENDFAVRWNTEWVPDQGSFGIQARALGADGKFRVSKVLDGLMLTPRPYVVKLYAPGPAPRNWVTRSGTFEQQLTIPDSLEQASAFQLNWVSWSPCYSNGLYVNGHLLWHRSEECYVFATHSPIFTGHDLQALQQGDNILSTGLTPLYRGKMVHGMEVQWPGIQVLVRYE